MPPNRHGPVPTQRRAISVPAAASAVGETIIPAATTSRMSAISRTVVSRSVTASITATVLPARYCAPTPGAPSVAPTAGSAIRRNETATAAASHTVPS